MLFVYLHSFINLFAGGRSTIKVILFFFYLVLALGYYYFFRTKKAEKTPLTTFLFPLGLLYLYGLVLHILYIGKFNFSVGEFVITANNGLISSSTIGHTHLAKGIIGTVLQWFSIPLANVDAGGAYLSFVPQVVYVLGLLLLVVVLIALGYYGRSYIANLHSKKNAWLYILLFCITTFSLVKTAIDGGILTPCVLLSLLALWALHRERWGKIDLVVLVTILLGFIVVLLQFFITIPWAQTVYQALALVLLYGAGLLWLEDNKRVTLMTLAVFLLFFYMSTSRDRDLLHYRATNIDTDALIFILPGESVKGEFLNSIGRGKLMKTTQYKKVRDIISASHTLDNHYPVSVPWQTCLPSSPNRMFNATLTTFSAFDQKLFPASQWVAITGIPSVPIRNTWKTKIEIQFKDCTPRQLNVADEYIRSAGYTQYFLSDIHTNDGTDIK